jgi:type 1 glutamine amidotransferase
MKIWTLIGVMALWLAPRVESAEVVMMIGEDEYRTWETLPEFAKAELEPRGHHVKILQPDAADKNSFPGLEEALAKAEVLWVSVRRRTLPKAQLAALREYVESGKPVIGIRTASHAFAPKIQQDLKDEALGMWPEFDGEVLGGNYQNHHRGEDKTVVTVTAGGSAHPILNGIRVEELVGNGTLYKNNPVKVSARVLLMGTVPGQSAEPVAWTHEAGLNRARVFYTSLGHPEDFKESSFRRLMVNAMDWVLGR